MNREILRLAVPSILTNITVPLLGLVDLAIVGHMGSERYIAAVAVGSMVFNVMYWLMGFLRMSTSGTTAQAFGQSDLPLAASLLRRGLKWGLAVGVLFLVSQWLLLRTALLLMSPEQNIVAFVQTYFNVCIWGAPAVLMQYALTGWFIGMQNTRLTMVVSVSQNVLNIVLSLCFVYLLGMKIEGVALGTMLSQWVGLLLAFLLLRKNFPSVGLSSSFGKGCGRVSHSPSFGRGWGWVPLALFLRTVCLVAVNLFFTAAGARQGNLVLSVNTLLMTFFMLFSYFMDGFAYAGEALCGRYYGANDTEGFQTVCKRLLWWGGIMIMLFTTAYLLGGRLFLQLLTSDSSVVEAAREYLPWVVLVPLFGMAAFVYDGVFIGITAAQGMLWSSFVATLFFFVIYYALFPVIGNHALWLALIVYLATRGIIQHLLLRAMLGKFLP